MRVNPTEVTLAFDELKVKFRKRFNTERALTKKAFAEYLWLKPSFLYNPSSFRDILFVRKSLIVIKSINIEDLWDFIGSYKHWTYDYKSRFKHFFGEGFDKFICLNK